MFISFVRSLFLHVVIGSFVRSLCIYSWSLFLYLFRYVVLCFFIDFLNCFVISLGMYGLIRYVCVCIYFPPAVFIYFGLFISLCMPFVFSSFVRSFVISLFRYVVIYVLCRSFVISLCLCLVRLLFRSSVVYVVSYLFISLCSYVYMYVYIYL